jgi:hypothetical protein
MVVMTGIGRQTQEEFPVIFVSCVAQHLVKASHVEVAQQTAKDIRVPVRLEKEYSSRRHISVTEDFLEAELREKGAEGGDGGEANRGGPGAGQITIAELLEHHHFGHRTSF